MKSVNCHSSWFLTAVCHCVCLDHLQTFSLVLVSWGRVTAPTDSRKVHIRRGLEEWMKLDWCACMRDGQWRRSDFCNQTHWSGCSCAVCAGWDDDWCCDRAAEVEKERLSVELEQVWSELCHVMRAVYHLDNSDDADTFDCDRVTRLVSRQVSLRACNACGCCNYYCCCCVHFYSTWSV